MAMTAKRKKRFTYIAIGALFLLSAIEYAVILPTVWLYIKQRFGAKLYLMGLILSAFSFAGLIASPLMGKWSDHTKDTKSVLLTANLFEIGGSIMYFLGISGWFLVSSRFVAGIGSGVISVLFADISRMTSVEERTAVMSSFMAVRQFGLLVGPGFNLILRELHFYIGPYIVDKYTAPGVFMMCLWIAYEVFVFFFYTNLPQLKIELELEKQRESASGSPCVSDPHIGGATSDDAILSASSSALETQARANLENDVSGIASTDDLIETAEKFMQSTERQTSKTSTNTASSDGLRTNSFPRRQSELSGDSEDSGGILFNAAPSMSGTGQSPEPCRSQSIPSYGQANNVSPSIPCVLYTEVNAGDGEVDCVDVSRHAAWTWRYYYNVHMKEEVVVILAVVFVAFFNQMIMETMATPLTVKLLHWGELENSLMYCAGGVEILLVFVLIRVLSRHVSDRNLLVAGFLVITVAVCILMWFLTRPQTISWMTNLLCLMSVMMLDMFGLPFVLVASTSLYSKVTREETQGFSQGIRRVAASLGMIMGPLWVSGLWDHLYIMFGVLLGMNVLLLLMLFLSYHRLVGPETVKEELERPSSPAQANETQPLLGRA